MRNLLKALLIVDIICIVIEFFVLLSNSLLLALLLIPLSVLGLVPLIAVIRNMDEIDDLRATLDRLRYEVKLLSDNSEPAKPHDDISLPERTETARGTWECLKCNTVNKAGTTRCSNCRAKYSAWANPTDNPYEKKKISKWIK